MVNYSALGEFRDQFYTDPLVGDPLLADRYPSYTPADQNLDYWRQLRLQTGIDKPRDELLNRPNPYPGFAQEDLQAPVWGGRQPAEPSKIPVEIPEGSRPNNPDYGTNAPISDAPTPRTQPPTYWNDDSFVPDRSLIRRTAGGDVDFSGLPPVPQDLSRRILDKYGDRPPPPTRMMPDVPAAGAAAVAGSVMSYYNYLQEQKRQRVENEAASQADTGWARPQGLSYRGASAEEPTFRPPPAGDVVLRPDGTPARGTVNPPSMSQSALGEQPRFQPVLMGGEQGAANTPTSVGPGRLKVAQQMAADGVPQRDVFEVTGWYRAPDGKWKWILSDQNASLVPEAFKPFNLNNPDAPVTRGGRNVLALRDSGNLKLPDILKHDDLFATYPSMKDVNVKALSEAEINSGATGGFDPDTNTLYVGGRRPGNQIMSSVLHELQHKIQTIEDFARGGMKSEFLTNARRAGGDSTSPEAETEAFRNYRRLAGETEGRQAARMWLERNWHQLPTEMVGDWMYAGSALNRRSASLEELFRSGGALPPGSDNDVQQYPKPSDQLVIGENDRRNPFTGLYTYKPGIQYEMSPEQAAPTGGNPPVDPTGDRVRIDPLSSMARPASAPSSALNNIPGGAPFPTIARPGEPPPMKWTTERPPVDPNNPQNYGPGSPLSAGGASTPMPANIPPPRNPAADIAAAAAARPRRPRARSESAPAQEYAPVQDYAPPANIPPPQPQTTSATAADRAQEIAARTRDSFGSVARDYPVVQKQEIITAPAPPGRQLEYWSPNEPGTPQRPRPASIPMDQAGLEIPADTPPMDILGDIVSHHMIKKDPVIKKYYESFVDSLTPEQKQTLQAQFMYYQKNEGETRKYADWEKNTGLPAYFRGYAFNQWSPDVIREAYTPEQISHFNQMMLYLRSPQPALQ
jgi:hypothetical protein